MAEDDALSRGQAYRAAVEAAYDLNETELLLLEEIAAVKDVIDALDPIDDRVEIRLQRDQLSRLTSRLALPALDGSAPVAASASQRGRKAANKRWAVHHG